jgi:hypothetical protein
LTMISPEATSRPGKDSIWMFCADSGKAKLATRRMKRNEVRRLFTVDPQVCGFAIES